jgi:hypothetical protein
MAKNVGANPGPGDQEIWLTKDQVFDPKAYASAKSILGKIPIIGGFLGGDMRRPEEKVSYGSLGASNVNISRADKQSAARSGLVHSGTRKDLKGKPKPDTDARGLASGAMLGGAGWTPYSPGRNASGMFQMGGGSIQGMHGYFSEDTGMQGRITGEMQGPMMMLKEFQGSNRGSHGYIASVPRYSIAETRQGVSKFDLKNFKALNKHAAKKFLEPGLERMMQRKAKEFTGSRKVTRKFL